MRRLSRLGDLVLSTFSWDKAGMQNRRILKEGTEDVREGKEMQAQVEDVPKGPGTKGKPVVGIRRKDLGREDDPKERRKECVMGTLRVK